MASRANPLTYTTDIFRTGLFNPVTPAVSVELTVLAIEAAVMLVIAVFALRWIRV